MFCFLDEVKYDSKTSCLIDEENTAKSNALMESLDAANHRYGRGTVKFGIEGFGRGVWALKQDHKSPAFTTEWDDVAMVKC